MRQIEVIMPKISDLLQRSWAPILVLLSLSACAGIDRQLMPAPNLYTAPDSPPLFKDLPEELENSNIDLLYVTDREPQTDSDDGLNYGYGRSRSAAFGSAVVAIRPHMDWKDLERVSIERDRSTRLTLEMISIEERDRFAETPGEVVRVDGQSRYATDFLETNRKATEAFRREILQRLALAPKDEVLIFIHGFNNDFDDAAYTLAELWHYMGRQHVPILYTWPAGRGGPSGYIYDRESGEFTVYHLKNLIRTISAIPEIKSFHMIG
ncbi:MAG: alpha/beta hydrolase, partial [Gammaproteobacteria bacterium]|nr:alpha/beta hydrolase [Gammaproteobacteria bacterium]